MPDNQTIERKTALIMAGGTGGHIFPGLAVADELENLGWCIHWLGSKGGMEENLVKNSQIPLHLLSIVGLRGNGIIGWIKAPFMLLSAIWQARKVIQRLAPDVILGFGGFASGPGGFSAYLTKTPLFIHEQNAVVGLTNNLLSKIATRIFQAFPNAFSHDCNAQTVGNPIRKNIRELTQKSKVSDNQTVNVFILGGSRGAAALNQNLPEILRESILNESINVFHQCGAGNLIDTMKSYAVDEKLDISRLNVVEFIDDMARAYKWANIIICRAGALTVSEVAAAGIAAVFIPYPYAVDDHQTANAQWLVELGAAEIIQQLEFESTSGRKEAKEKIISILNNPQRINQMSSTAKNAAYTDACTEIVSACEQLLGEAA